jgi:sec-independent protein translocase protein TatA
MASLGRRRGARLGLVLQSSHSCGISWLQGALMFALFGPIGLPEMLIILAIVILIFGANRLPELGKGIGAGIKNFKSSMSDKDDK